MPSGVPPTVSAQLHGRQQGTGGHGGGEAWRDRKRSWNPGEHAGLGFPGKASCYGMPSDAHGTQRGPVGDQPLPAAHAVLRHGRSTVAFSEMCPGAG